MAAILHKPSNTSQCSETLSAVLDNVKARYVRMVVPVRSGWVFLDEIFVNPDSQNTVAGDTH